MRILYVGEHTAINLTKNEFDISFDRTPIELLNIRNIVSEYNILVIEISPEKIDTILKWVFKLYCEKKYLSLRSCMTAAVLIKYY